jgi:uncharacterized membrane protein YgcG
MKLNLLPVTVRKGAKSRPAWIVSILLALGGAGAAFALITISQKDLKEVKDQVEEARPKADEAYAISTQADDIIQKAQPVLKNTNLAKAMIRHNAVYPAAYEDIFRYNPPYFRLTSITATPSDEKTATIVMTGTISSYQQYADLTLALQRNPKVISVSRQGYDPQYYIKNTVPPIVPADQEGRPHKLGDPPIPVEGEQRLAYFESLPKRSGYLGVSNFGSGTENTRLQMVGDSLITITMIAKYELQTPNPRATLSGGGGGSSTPVVPSGGARTGGGGKAGGGGGSD